MVRLMFFSDIDATEIEKLRSQRMDLEESVATLEETSKKLQDAERRLSNEAANLRRQRVGRRKFVLYRLPCFKCLYN